MIPCDIFFLYPISIIITLVITYIAWTNRVNTVSNPFILLMAASTIWTAGDWVITFIPDPIVNQLVISTYYPAIVTVPVAWLMTVIYYMRKDAYINNKVISFLFIIPALAVIAVITNPMHHLFYTSIVPEYVCNHVIWQYSHGILFSIYIIYPYLLVIIGICLIILRILDLNTFFQKQTLILFCSSLIPFICNLFYVVNSEIQPAFDLTPFSFTIVGILMAVGIFRYELFSIVPLAYLSLFQSMHDGVFATDTNYNILNANPMALKICKEKTMDPVGTSIHDIIPEINKYILNQDKNSEYNHELMIEREREKTWYELSYHPLSSGSKNLGYLFTFRDISYRRSIESKLHDSQEKLRIATEGARIGIWEYHIKENKLFINQKIPSIHLATDQSTIDSFYNFKDFINPDDLKNLLESIEKYASGEKKYLEFDLPVKCSDGSIRWIYINGKFSKFDEDGNPLIILGMSLDISDRKLAHEILEKTNQKLNLLSSITRHDILNQVFGLLGYLNVSTEMNKEQIIDDYLKKCHIIVKTIQNQIEFTRIFEEIGSTKPKWQNLSIIIRKVQRDLPNAIIDYHTNIEGLMIYGDSLFEKVIFTLLENSIRHGLKVTEVWFNYQIQNSGLLLIYEDNGIGIKRENKERIYEKNFGNNTGLGLFLVREILSITGMSIKENGKENEGVKFEISIPDGIWKILG